MSLKNYILALAVSTCLLTPSLLAQDAVSVVNAALSKYKIAAEACDIRAMNAFMHTDEAGFNGFSLAFERKSHVTKAKSKMSGMEWCNKGGKISFSYEILNAEFVGDDRLMTTIVYDRSNMTGGNKVSRSRAYSTVLMVKTGEQWQCRYFHTTEMKKKSR